MQRWLSDLLCRPWYEPHRNDGSGRRHRYPKRTAALIRQADDWLRDAAGDDLFAALTTIDDERERRAWLCTCPGVGPKTASWILRNVGLGEELAILDVHVLRALERAGRISDYRLPRDYDRLEHAFLMWTCELDAAPAVFDLFLWEFGRGDATFVSQTR